MTTRLRKLLDDLGETFWLIPFAMVRRHARLMLAAAERDIGTPDDLSDVRRRSAEFHRVCGETD